MCRGVCRGACGPRRLCLPPHCWCCSSCPSSLCWPSRSPTSCRSPSLTRKRRRASPRCTSAGREQDTHLPDASETSKSRTQACCEWSGGSGSPPFCLRQLSALCPGFGASDLGPLQQRFLLRVPLLLRSPVFQSRSFSLSGITTTSSSGALRQ